MGPAFEFFTFRSQRQNIMRPKGHPFRHLTTLCDFHRNYVPSIFFISIRFIDNRWWVIWIKWINVAHFWFPIELSLDLKTKFTLGPTFEPITVLAASEYLGQATDCQENIHFHGGHKRASFHGDYDCMSYQIFFDVVNCITSFLKSLWLPACLNSSLTNFVLASASRVAPEVVVTAKYKFGYRVSCRL